MRWQLFFASGSSEVLLILVFVGVLVSLLLMYVTVLQVAGAPRKRLRQRIARIKSADAPVPQSVKAQSAIRSDASYSSIRSLDRLLRRVIPQPTLLRDRIARAGLGMSLGVYVLVVLLTGAVTSVLVGYFMLVPSAAAVLAGITAGAALPHAALSILANRRLSKFTNQFPEAIDLIVRGIKSGLPVPESIKAVAQEFPAPLGPEFRQISDAIRFGATLNEALWGTAKRLDTAEFKFFVISLSIQQETGGNLAETLQNLSDILRKRRQMRLKVNAMSSEGRASALIIGSLPFVMFGIIYMLNPEYLSMLFTDPRGMMMVAVVLVLMLFGMGVMYKMVKFEI